MFIAQEGGHLPLQHLLCHTQAVESVIKTNTEALAKLSKKNVREGFIKAQIERRKDIPV